MNLKRIEVHFEKGIVRLDQKDGPEIILTAKSLISSSYDAAKKDAEKSGNYKKILAKKIRAVTKELNTEKAKDFKLSDKDLRSLGLTDAHELNRDASERANALGKQRIEKVLGACEKLKNEISQMEI